MSTYNSMSHHKSSIMHSPSFININDQLTHRISPKTKVHKRLKQTGHGPAQLETSWILSNYGTLPLQIAKQAYEDF